MRDLRAILAVGYTPTLFQQLEGVLKLLQLGFLRVRAARHYLIEAVLDHVLPDQEMGAVRAFDRELQARVALEGELLLGGYFAAYGFDEAVAIRLEQSGRAQLFQGGLRIVAVPDQ